MDSPSSICPVCMSIELALDESGDPTDSYFPIDFDDEYPGPEDYDDAGYSEFYPGCDEPDYENLF